MEIEYDGDLVACAWFHWGLEDRAIWCHAAAREDWRGRWLTRDVVRQLFKIVDITQCNTLRAAITSDISERIWRRFGFEITDGVAVKSYGE